MQTMLNPRLYCQIFILACSLIGLMREKISAGSCECRLQQSGCAIQSAAANFGSLLSHGKPVYMRITGNNVVVVVGGGDDDDDDDDDNQPID